MKDDVRQLALPHSHLPAAAALRSPGGGPPCTLAASMGPAPLGGTLPPGPRASSARHPRALRPRATPTRQLTCTTEVVIILIVIVVLITVTVLIVISGAQSRIAAVPV